MDLGSTDGCDNQYGYGLVQAKNAYELLAEGNCGGDIGTDEPTGGCEQLYPEPNCEVDSDCDNGQCQSTPDCASCGKSKLDVEITIDNYGEETTYDVKDSSGTKVMEGSGWPSNSVNSFWKCVASGAYTFTIKDGYGDGLCCTYGQGGYVVKANDVEVASGGDFDSEETKTFDVADLAPTTPAPVSPTTAPVAPPTPGTPGAPTLFPTHVPPTMHPTQTAPTPYPTDVPPTPYPTGPTCAIKNDPCEKHSDCCKKKCNLKKKFCRK